jgi:hypothetical protein
MPQVARRHCHSELSPTPPPPSPPPGVVDRGFPPTPPPMLLDISNARSPVVERISPIVGLEQQPSKNALVHDRLINNLLEQENLDPAAEGEFTELEGLMTSPFKPSNWNALHREAWEKREAEKLAQQREQVVFRFFKIKVLGRQYFSDLFANVKILPVPQSLLKIVLSSYS